MCYSNNNDDKICGSLKVAQEFSIYPGGRTREDGNYSAEEFVELIREKFKTYGYLYIYLDNVRGYAYSFLNEFCTRLTEEEANHITCVSSDDDYLCEIKQYNPNIKTMKMDKV